jgi:hypothetical protein
MVALWFDGGGMMLLPTLKIPGQLFPRGSNLSSLGSEEVFDAREQSDWRASPRYYRDPSTSEREANSVCTQGPPQTDADDSSKIDFDTMIRGKNVGKHGLNFILSTLSRKCVRGRNLKLYISSRD